MTMADEVVFGVSLIMVPIVRKQYRGGFPQSFTHLFGHTPPGFEALRFSLDAHDTIQRLVLLIGLIYLAFRDKVGLSWVTTLTPTPETRDAAQEQATGARDTAPQPDPAPLSTLEMNHPDWTGVQEETGRVLREYSSSDGANPSPCFKEGKSNGAAMEPTEITTVQVPPKASLTQDSSTDQVFRRQPGPLPLWEGLLMNVREDCSERQTAGAPSQNALEDH